MKEGEPMKVRTQRAGYVLCGLMMGLVVACKVEDNTQNLHEMGSLSPTLDLAGVDLAIGPGSIGAACTKAADCNTGKTPVCWRNNVLDDPGNLPTTGGYCTSSCQVDDDCGGYGSCLSVQAGAPKFCLRTCFVANTCRIDQGFACFPLSPVQGYCYPSTRLSCNPTSIDQSTKNGTCPGASPESACVRRAFEDLGECREVCNFGVSTCPARDGLRQHCVYLDATVDGYGNATRDTFRGLACFPQINNKQAGDDCSYVDDCADGLQCNLVKAGDRKCRTLCIVGDGSTCQSGTTCRDVFLAGAGKSGLCVPQ